MEKSNLDDPHSLSPVQESSTEYLSTAADQSPRQYDSTGTADDDNNNEVRILNLIRKCNTSKFFFKKDDYMDDFMVDANVEHPPSTIPTGNNNGSNNEVSYKLFPLSCSTI